jgi:hypothetical protein
MLDAPSLCHMNLLITLQLSAMQNCDVTACDVQASRQFHVSLGMHKIEIVPLSACNLHRYINVLTGGYANDERSTVG